MFKRLFLVLFSQIAIQAAAFAIRYTPPHPVCENDERGLEFFLYDAGMRYPSLSPTIFITECTGVKKNKKSLFSFYYKKHRNTERVS